MSNQRLQQQLEQLQHTLATHPELDAESLVLLQKVAADLKEMGIETDASLSIQLQEQALSFEQEYPTLAEILRSIVNTLGNIGV